MGEAHTESPTAIIARFVSDLCYERIPAEVIAVELEVMLRDGRCLKEKVLQAKGGEANPVGETELEQKFRLLASKVLEESQVEELYHTVRHLEKVDDVKTLSTLLAHRG